MMVGKRGIDADPTGAGPLARRRGGVRKGSDALKRDADYHRIQRSTTMQALQDFIRGFRAGAKETPAGFVAPLRWLLRQRWRR